MYVDSGSTDGSVAAARGLGAGCGRTRSRHSLHRGARNAGFARLVATAPDLAYVQFVDGDCELAPRWPEAAIGFLDAHAYAAAACGRLRERHPDRSVYNWLCDKEWDRPPARSAPLPAT
ncbi:glycosyltransferase [Bradyrhizobium sp. CCBAU 051011]|uniref:glycosyltransferase n=1 Tax=Bradyrhizobium sp. CCBAU 051011 TaxID=858422 RepID=UPI00137A963C|nr:glycosyltransferase [Bradyrhizobium sp. CCBAU 051011]